MQLRGMLETSLYPAVKRFLETTGFRVKGEVAHQRRPPPTCPATARSGAVGSQPPRRPDRCDIPAIQPPPPSQARDDAQQVWVWRRSVRRLIDFRRLSL